MTTDGLLVLIAVLERDGWSYRTYWEFVRDETTRQVIKQVLKVVFFTNNELMS